MKMKNITLITQMHICIINQEFSLYLFWTYNNFKDKMHKRKSNNKSHFSIDLKISGKVMSVPVHENDTHETLVKRFCSNHLIKNQYQQIVKQKIIQSLLQILKNNQIQPSLKEKVEKFVEEKGKQNNPSKTFSRSSPNKLEKDTPFKILQGDKSIRKSSSNRHVGSQCLKMSPPKQRIVSKPKGIKKNNINKPKQRKSLMDNDLIKAYETIYKKSRQPNMKNMAKKYLQSCGYFANHKLQVPQLSEISANTPDISMNPIPAPSQFSPSKNQSSFEINRKYESMEQPPYHQRQGKKSRNYLQNHEQSLIFNNRYTTESGDLSKYHYFEGPRASKSFERLNPPQTIMNRLYDDSMYYEQISRRQNSMRKTRKYRYLD